VSNGLRVRWLSSGQAIVDKLTRIALGGEPEMPHSVPPTGAEIPAARPHRPFPIWRWVGIATLVLIFVLIAALSGGVVATQLQSQSNASHGPSYPSSQTIVVPHADRFEPFVTEVARGATVTFRNDDTDEHSVVSMPTDPLNFRFLVKPHQTVSYTFSQAGIYGYYCDVHSKLDPSTGLIKARQGTDAYPVSMYGLILVVDSSLAVNSGTTKAVIPAADRFQPLGIVVHRGTTVTWENLDSVEHTVTAVPSSATSFNLTLVATKSSSETFNNTGIHPYYCAIHAQWNSDLKRVQARAGASDYPAAMEGVVFVVP
jgi:plastocyanin